MAKALIIAWQKWIVSQILVSDFPVKHIQSTEDLWHFKISFMETHPFQVESTHFLKQWVLPGTRA
jgi:hypothetical protein